MFCFTAQIKNWQDWGKLFQSLPIFAPLTEQILKKHALPIVPIENLTPGTNAVFKAGNYVIKIYAPNESGMDQTLDQKTEKFAACFAANKGVSVPRLVAEGFVRDKYHFAYSITEYIYGSNFTQAVEAMNSDEKIRIAQKLRHVTDLINLPCQDFNGIDIINDIDRHKRWSTYQESFKTERLNFIKSYKYGAKVFVHGDLCADNILVSPNFDIHIIDFADAVLAPIVYEHALIAVELFKLDPALLSGYFGNYSIEQLTDLCVNGLLIHDFGGDILRQFIGNWQTIRSLEELRIGMRNLLVSKSLFPVLL